MGVQGGPLVPGWIVASAREKAPAVDSLVALKTEVAVPATYVVPSPCARTVPSPGSCVPSTSTLSNEASSPRVRARRKSEKPESGAWMLRKRARPLPWLVKAWTFPGGTTTAVPARPMCFWAERELELALQEEERVRVPLVEVGDAPE